MLQIAPYILARVRPVGPMAEECQVLVCVWSTASADDGTQLLQNVPMAKGDVASLFKRVLGTLKSPVPCRRRLNKQSCWKCAACGADRCWASRSFCYSCGVKKGFRPARKSWANPSKVEPRTPPPLVKPPAQVPAETARHHKRTGGEPPACGDKPEGLGAMWAEEDVVALLIRVLGSPEPSAKECFF